MTKLTASPERSRRRSWVDVVIDGVNRVPGPTWLVYLVGTLVLAATGSLIAWSDGTVDPGALSFVRVFTDSTVLYQLAVIHFLVWSAGRALAAYAPALGSLASSRDRLEWRLTRIPRWISIAGIVLGAAYASSFLFGDPAGVGLTDESSSALWVFVSVTTVVSGVFFAVLVLFVLHQMIAIVHIHAKSTELSVFDAPVHGAFARLTLRSSLGLVIPVYVFTTYQLLAGNPDGEITIPELVTVVSLIGGAIGLFFIPLAGVHWRLLRQRSELIASANRRFAAATQEVHRRADSGSLGGMEELEKLLAALVSEREVVRKLSTWPWEPETLRAFLSSIALPILVWFITSLLGRVLGA